MYRTLIACAGLAAGAAHAQQAVILVRHAELDTGVAKDMDARRVPLSETGNARAQRLAGLLERAGVAAVYATDFARTQQTAEPMAKLAGVQVTVTRQDDPADFVARLRHEHPHDVVLVVGHTDTLPGLIDALGRAEKVSIDRSDFGNVFVLTPKDAAPPALLRLRY